VHDETHDLVTFRVSDTGVGIAEADQLKIFQEFSQIENPLQRRVKGTGLGLSLAKKLSELLGGYVELKSELNKGSVFSVTVPRKFKNAEAAEAVDTTASQTAEAHQLKALIVDDNEATCYTLKRALNSLECVVVEAEDGVEGLRAAHEERPDLIFLDIIMPDMNGLEVLDRLKSAPDTKDIPVVIHTSQDLSLYEKQALRKSAFDTTTKSMTYDQAVAYTKNLISQIPLREAS